MSKSIQIIILRVLAICVLWYGQGYVYALGQEQETLAMVEIPVKVIVDQADWVQSIEICNNTSNALPLKHVQFQLNFPNLITSIWGEPWLDWKVLSRTNNTYVFDGGTAYAAPLPSDPNCKQPMVIKFSSNPSAPVPTGPFIFKSEGATPIGKGTLNISVPIAPGSGVSSPTISVVGMGTETKKIVSWGQTWKIENLSAGAYSITSTTVDNGNNFYELKPISTAISDGKTTNVSLQYVAVPTTSVIFKLINAPSAQSTVLLTGKQFTFNKTIANNTSLRLPADSYVITTSTPGYSVTASPNPLVVPGTTSVTLTFVAVNLRSSFGAYFQTWSSKYANDPTKSDLGQLPGYVTHVYLAFAKPDANYVKGSLNYLTMGLEFNYPDGKFLKDAIAHLHKMHPQTKVLLAVGGATFNNWRQLNPQALADFVVDFGLDGIDIDYEAANPGCAKGSDNLIHCQIDQLYQSIVESIRQFVPRPYELVATAWSISAYGQDQWSNAQPQGEYTGMMLPFFRSAAAKNIDRLNVMSYDASDAYNPVEALAAFSYYYAGPINMGVEVPPEAWGGHVYTLAKVHTLTQAVISNAAKRNTGPGMMLWSLQKMPIGLPSADNPNAQMMATTICSDLGLQNCSEPIFKS